MSTGPRTKRQFAGAASDPAQRQITSFFNKTSNPTSHHHHAHEKTTPGPLNGPALPAHIQSNLISVGMRVRKSVPEGYKTGGAYSGFSLWSDNNSGGSGGGSNSSAADARPVPAVPSSQYTGGSSARELTPFCGIHKVGGLAVQPETIDYSSLRNGPSGCNSLPSSQESVMSNLSITSAMAAASSTAMNRKRFYTEEEEDQTATRDAGENDIQRYTSGWLPENDNGKPNRNMWRNKADWLDGEISPRSPAPAEWGDGNARVMAIPKRRIATATARSNGNGGGLLLPPGASVPAAGGMAVDDFEEANFLDFRFGSDGADMDF